MSSSTIESPFRRNSSATSAAVPEAASERLKTNGCRAFARAVDQDFGTHLTHAMAHRQRELDREQEARLQAFMERMASCD